MNFTLKSCCAKPTKDIQVRYRLYEEENSESLNCVEAVAIFFCL
jgi:hypothetical protein